MRKRLPGVLTFSLVLVSLYTAPMLLCQTTAAALASRTHHVPYTLPGDEIARLTGLALGDDTAESYALNGLDAANYDIEYGAWQIINFGSTNAIHSGQNDDYDGDRFDNWSEFFAGTDPTNASAYLNVNSSVPNEHSVALSWPSTPGRHYNVLAAEGLDTPFAVIESNITATVPENTIVISAPTNIQTRYYRIAVSGYESSYSTNGLQPPTNVVASHNIYTDKVVVAWSAVSNATAYYVYPYKYLNDTSPAIGMSSTPSFEDRTASPGVGYYYRVKSFHPSSGLSDYSEVSTEGYRAKYLSPYLPTGVTASAGAYTDRISLNWYPVDDAETYCIYRNGSELYHTYHFVGETDQTSFEDFFPSHSNTYRYNYLVLSYNEARGLSLEYDIFMDHRVGYLKPDMPTGVIVKPGGLTPHRSLYIYCDKQDNRDFRYHYYCSPSPDGPYSSFDSGDQVTPGVLYYLKARVSYFDVWSDFTEPVSGHVPLCEPYFFRLRASAGTFEDKVHLYWTNYPAAEKYIIYRSPTSAPLFEKIGETSESYFDDITAEENRVFHYKMNPYNELCGEVEGRYIYTGYKKLMAPTGLTVTNAPYDGYIKLLWNPENHVDKYEFYRSTSPTGTYTRLLNYANGTNDYKYTDVPERGVVYYYKFDYGVDGIAERSPLSSHYACGSVPMLQPYTVQATAGDHEDKVRVTWTANTNADTFIVYRGTFHSNPFSEIGRTNTFFYDDTTAIPGKQYVYKVCAYNDETGHSPTSDCTAYAYRGSAPPQAPTHVTATDGTYTNCIRITWNSPSYADEYMIYRNDTPDGEYTRRHTATDPAARSYEDTNIDAETTYYYKVRARTYSCSYSDESAYDSGHAQGGNAPAAPTGVVAHDGGFTDYVKVQWDTVAAADRYDVYHCSTPNGTYTKIASQPHDYARSFEDTNTLLGATNYYKIKTYSTTGGTSGFSEYDGGYKGLAIPTDVKASDGLYYQTIRIDWPQVSLADRYSIYRSTSLEGPYSKIIDTTAAYYEDTPPARTLPYYYKMQAYDATLGYSGLSVADSGYAEGASATPAAPTAVVASDGRYSDRVYINWNRIDNAVFYYVYRSATEDGVYSQIGITSNYYGTSFDDQNTSIGVTYFYKVKAYTTTGGYSELSEPDGGYAGTSIPDWVDATEGTIQGAIGIYWNAVTGAEQYHIYRSTSEDGTFAEIASKAGSPYDDTNAVPGRVYYYKIKAYDALHGYSAFSKVTSGYANIQRPQSMYASDGLYDDRVHLSWDSVPSADQYYIYRSDSDGVQGSVLGHTTAVSFDDVSAVAGAIYYYCVKAYSDEAGYSRVTYQTRGYIGLSMPEHVVASDGTHSNYVHVSWDAVAGAELYKVYRGSSIGGSCIQLDSTEDLALDDMTAYPGKTYYYKVRACNANSTSPYSEADAGYLPSPAQPPSAPSGISASKGRTDGTILVSWEQVSDATRYHIYRSASLSDIFHTIGNCTALNYEDTTASPDITYYYRVKTYNTTGYSDFSAYATGYHIELEAPPLAPFGVTASDGTDTAYVLISWQAASNSTGYSIYRSATPYGTYSELGKTASHSYQDISAAPGVTYCYKVQATNAAGRSDFSTYDSGYRPAISLAPDAPKYLTASDGIHDKYVRLVWNPVATATRYYVYRSISVSGNFVAVGDTPTPSYDDTLATPGTTYYYKIKAYNTNGLSKSSSCDSGYRNVAHATPNAPTGLSASDSTFDEYIQLTWSAVPEATRYYIYRSTHIARDYTVIANTAEATYNDTLTTPRVTYYYKVGAYNTNGFSSLSAHDSGQRADNGSTPHAPDGLSASDGTFDGYVRLSWNSVAGATRYYIHRSESETGNYLSIGTTTAATYDDTLTAPGTTYFYQIKASNASGLSEPGACDSGYRRYVGVAPNAPTGVKASDGAYESFVEISWNLVADAERYYIYRSTSPNGTYSLLVNTLASYYSDRTVSEDITYYYKVKSYTPTGGFSEFSAYSAGSSKSSQTPPLSAPSAVSATHGTSNGYVSITWSSVNNATRYHIYRSTSSSATFQQIGTATSSPYDDTTATSGVFYYYKLKAYNANGYSAFSAYTTGSHVDPATPPMTPPGVTASDGDYADYVRISWAAVSSATQYYVYRATSSHGSYERIGTSTTTSFNDTTVPAGSTHYYKVRSYNAANGYSDLSAYDGGYRKAITLAVPSGVSATDDTYTDRIHLVWNTVSAADRYYIYRSTSLYNLFSEVGHTTSSYYDDTSATAGLTYYYKVKAYSSSSSTYSKFSSPDSGQRKAGQTAPAAPTGVSASDGNYDTYIQISWNTVSGVERYYVYRSTSPDGSYAQIGNTLATYYSDRSASPGVSYYYKVKAYSPSGGYSAYSAYDSGCKPNPSIPPPAPTGVTASDGESLYYIDVDWNAVFGADRYHIYRSTSPNGNYVEIADTYWTTIHDRDVTPRTTYYYKVKAYDTTSGYSSLSESSSGYASLQPPRFWTAGSSSTEVLLEWTSDGIPTSYSVYRSTSPNGNYVQIASGITSKMYKEVPPIPNTTYYYKLKGYHPTYGYSDFSEYESIIAPFPSPTKCYAEPHPGNSIKFRWKASEPAAARYHIYRCEDIPEGVYSEIGTTTSTQYIDSTVADQSTYYYRVKAYIPSIGYSELSRKVYAKTAGSPCRDLTLHRDGLLFWDQPLGYYDTMHLYRSTSPSGPYTEIFTSRNGENNRCVYDDGPNMENATVYYYRLRSYHAPYGFSDYIYTTGCLLHSPILRMPSRGTFCDRVHLSWEGWPEASEYVIYRRVDYFSKTPTEVGRTTAENFDDYTAQPGIEYYYGVKAIYNGLGESRVDEQVYTGFLGQ